MILFTNKILNIIRQTASSKKMYTTVIFLESHSNFVNIKLIKYGNLGTLDVIETFGIIILLVKGSI